MAPEKPLIGVTAGTASMPIPEGVLAAHYAGSAYSYMLDRVGAVPVLLPVPESGFAARASDFLDQIDGLVLAGGIDIEPRAYGGAWAPSQTPDPARDALERELVRAAIDRDVPVLGICRGMQILNIAYGGTLHEHMEHEDVEAKAADGFEGVRRHRVELVPGSRVVAAFDRPEVDVYCLHHQAPDRIGEGLTVTARAGDGTVEALELERDDRFALGVQWHPEQMADAVELQAGLFQSLLAAIADRRAAS